MNFDRFDDPKFGVIWLAWVVLFGAFFALLALGWDFIAKATGWLAILEAFTTTTVPGALMLTGRWDDVSTTMVVAVHVLVVVVFLGLAATHNRSATTRLEGANA